MIENQYVLKPSERFPKEMEAPKRADVLIELSKFGIGSANTIKLIDTTRDVRDVRLNYIIDKKWVLRFCNAPDMTEKRMGELNRLIGRYRAMGSKCPAFIADDNGKYLHPWEQFLCYLSEYIDRPLASDIGRFGIQTFAVNSKQFSVNCLVACFRGTRISRMCLLMTHSISLVLLISI